jgi:hypothetical protein
MEFCREPGCPGIAVTGRFCPDHKNSTTLTVRDRHPNEAWYGRAAWRGRYGVRRFKLRHTPNCEYVEKDGAHCTAKATDVHHIDGSWKETSNWVLFIGGVGTLENPTPNLMSLCHFHHSQITMDSIKSGEAVDHSKGAEQCTSQLSSSI